MALFGQKKPVNPLGMGIGQTPVPAMQSAAPVVAPMSYGEAAPQGGFSRPAQGFDAAAAINAPTKRKGGGLFGKDSALWKVLGTFGDAVTGNPVYSQIALERRKMEHEDQMREERRAADLEDYAKKQEIEAQYRAPPAPNDTERDYQFWQERLSPQDFQKWLMNRVIDPPRFGMVNGMPAMIGGYQGPQSAPAAPQGPVGTLKPYGGQPSPAAGNFPR